MQMLSQKNVAAVLIVVALGLIAAFAGHGGKHRVRPLCPMATSQHGCRTGPNLE